MWAKSREKFLLVAIVVLILLVGALSAWTFRDSFRSKSNYTNEATSSNSPSAKQTTPTATTPIPADTTPATPPFVGTPAEIVWGNRNRKEVVFTFDGGAGIQSFQPILDTLQKHHVKGTFFLTGSWANKNQELTKQIVQKGHEIFNHTYNHPRLTEIPDEQIISEFKTTDDLIFKLTGKHTKPYFRPPYGARNDHVREVAAKEGYQLVYWSCDALDWKESSGQTAQQVKSRIMENLKPGTIYLMHIGDNITGQILDGVFQEIKSQGYSIASLTQGVK